MPQIRQAGMSMKRMAVKRFGMVWVAVAGLGWSASYRSRVTVVCQCEITTRCHSPLVEWVEPPLCSAPMMIVLLRLIRS